MASGGARPGAGRKRKEYHYPDDTAKSTVPPVTTEDSGFTDEQMKQLRKSPYIRKVTKKTVSYTLTFKELFWKRYNEGTSPPQIFDEAGLDVDVLGDTRVYGLLTMLRRTKQRGVPFTDGREPQQPAKKEQPYEPIPKPPRMPPLKKYVVGKLDEGDVRQLMHQVAYLTQEMEFLKKIMSPDDGGKSR